MKISMRTCRTRLAVVWFIGAGFLFILFIFQTVFEHYGNKTTEAWGWLLPTVLPTLSLITGVFATDVLGKSLTVKTVDQFLYRLTLSLSSLYLLAVSLTIFVRPLTNFNFFGTNETISPLASAFTRTSWHNHGSFLC